MQFANRCGCVYLCRRKVAQECPILPMILQVRPAFLPRMPSATALRKVKMEPARCTTGGCAAVATAGRNLCALWHQKPQANAIGAQRLGVCNIETLQYRPQVQTLQCVRWSDSLSIASLSTRKPRYGRTQGVVTRRGIAMLWHEPRVEPPATKTSSASSSFQNEMFGV